MSDANFQYQFYFSQSHHFDAVNRLISANDPAEQVLAALDLHSAMSDEQITAFTLTPRFLRLEFSAPIHTRINHRLVRAFKEFGCEYCFVSCHDHSIDQLTQTHLLRGQKVDATELEALIAHYEPNFEIHNALQNDSDKFIALLKAGLDANLWVDGHTLLELAVMYNNHDAFNALLAAGADVDATLSHGDTLLMQLLQAQQRRDLKLIVQLINNGANFNQLDQQGASVLWHLAAFDKRLAATLAKQGATFSRPNECYQADALSNLQLALQHNDRDEIKATFASCAKHSTNWLAIAQACAQSDQLIALEPLLKQGFNPFLNQAQPDFSLLLQAAHAQSLAVLVRLIQCAKEQELELDELVQELVTAIAGNQKSSQLLQGFIALYPSSVTEMALSCALEYQQLKNLGILLSAELSFAPNSQLLHQHLFSLSNDALELLLDAGFNPLIADEDGLTVISRALKSKTVAPTVQQTLLASLSFATPEERILYSLECDHAASFAQSFDEIQDQDMCNAQGFSLATLACRNGCLNIMQFLLEQRINLAHLDHTGNTLLGHAVLSGNHDMVQLLLQHGANANDHISVFETPQGVQYTLEPTPLEKLAEQVHGKVTISGNDSTCLMYAAANGDVDIAQALINAHANVNTLDDSDTTAIFYATANAHTHCFNLLKNHGADLAHINAQGESLLHIAAQRGNAELSELLIKHGCNLDHADNKQQTPLMRAVKTAFLHQQDVLTALLNGAANINAQDEHHSSALMLAAQTGNQRVIRDLLAYGASTDLVDDHAHTAYDYFIEFGHQANEFTLKELKPKSSLVGAKKLATLASQFALRYLLPVGLIGGISYQFAPQYLVHSLSIALVLCIVQLVLSLKSSKQKGAGRMDLALRDGIETMMRDFQNNAQQISQEQAIIDSWDDEKTA